MSAVASCGKFNTAICVSLETFLPQQQLFAAGRRSFCLLALQSSRWWLCYHTCVDSRFRSHLQATSAKPAWLLRHDYCPSNIHAHTHTHTNTQPSPPFALPRDDHWKQSPLTELNSQKSHCWKNPYKNIQAFRRLRDVEGEKKGNCMKEEVASADYVSLTHGSMLSVEVQTDKLVYFGSLVENQL